MLCSYVCVSSNSVSVFLRTQTYLYIYTCIYIHMSTYVSSCALSVSFTHVHTQVVQLVSNLSDVNKAHADLKKSSMQHRKTDTAALAAATAAAAASSSIAAAVCMFVGVRLDA